MAEESGAGADRERMIHGVERVATYFAVYNGLPPISGRILGWLMVCDPAEQSAAELAEAVGASRASLTNSLRVLTASGFVAARTRPGERSAYYHLRPDAWAEVARRRMASLASFTEITEEGLALLAADEKRAERVRAAHDLFEWLSTEIEPMWQRWYAHDRRPAQPPEK